MKFEGTLKGLIKRVEGLGFPLEEVKEIPYGHQLVCSKGLKLSWWPSKGTVLAQGKAGAKWELEWDWGDTEQF
ncbi:hypothetical protein DU002_18215 [Corallincola holothuriorum]|uniref:Uncharacterized protein n=1 Tax=Corallincola holothuriorum TaxID=2282215 RepID=A0A368N0P7_9GAMM|nr:hypothetical protein DU002_18215 [Corallincola holothuriorum]